MHRNLTASCFMLIALILAVPFVFFNDVETVEATYLTETKYCPSVEVNGTVEIGEAIPISLSYPVFIKEQYVFENDFVNKGQLLFTIDTEKMKSAVKANNLSLYAEAYSSMDKSVLANISEGIYASESGYVTQITANSGNIVLSDENLCVINTQDDLILKITINQDDYNKISVGDTIEFSTMIMPSKIYYGHICDNTAIIRKETGLTGSKTVVDVYATIDDYDEKIVNGLQFTGKIYKDDVKSIFTLPYEYIYQDNGGEYVNTFYNNKIEKVYIETGVENEDCAEIKTNFENDTLFLKNNYSGKKKILIKYALE